MKKLLCILVLAAVMLVAFVALILPRLIPQDSLKGIVISQISAQTGKKLEIAGDFRASLFPTMGFHAEGVKVFAPKGAVHAEELIADIKELDIGIDTLDMIFKKKVSIEAFHLDSAKIFLRVDKNGLGNWEPEYGSGNNPENPEAAKLPPGEKNVFANSIMVEDIKIKDSALSFEDARSGSKHEISELNASMKIASMDAPADISGKAVVNGKDVVFDAVLDTPQSLLLEQDTIIEADVKSEYVTCDMRGVIKGPVFQGEIDMQSPSLVAFSGWLGLTLPDMGKHPLKANINGKFEHTAVLFTMTDTQIGLDGLQAYGSVSVRNEPGELPRVDLDLDTQNLDLTPYAAVPKSIGWMDAHAAEAGWSREPFDFSVLKTLNGSANLRLNGVVFKGLTIGKGLLQAKLERGVLGVDVVDTEVADGKLTAMSKLDTAYNAVTSRILLSGTRLEQLLSPLGYKQLSGAANADISIATQGKNQADWASELKGDGQLQVADGSYTGFDILAIVGNIKSALRLSNQADQKTEFSSLGGSFTIKKGVASNNDLQVKSPLLHVTGKGTVNIAERTLKYRLLPELLANSATPGIPVPLLLQGSWDDHTIMPDAAGVVRGIIESPEMLTKGSLKEKAKSLKGLLQGL